MENYTFLWLKSVHRRTAIVDDGTRATRFKWAHANPPVLYASVNRASTGHTASITRKIYRRRGKCIFPVSSRINSSYSVDVKYKLGKAHRNNVRAAVVSNTRDKSHPAGNIIEPTREKISKRSKRFGVEPEYRDISSKGQNKKSCKDCSASETSSHASR